MASFVGGHGGEDDELPRVRTLHDFRAVVFIYFQHPELSAFHMQQKIYGGAAFVCTIFFRTSTFDNQTIDNRTIRRRKVPGLDFELETSVLVDLLRQ